jgi:hypothetical protein
VNISIYSTCPATQLEPNAVVDTDKHGPLVIDEVRKLWDPGYSGRVVVDVYGRRPDAPEDAKNRRRVRFDGDEIVRLQPGAVLASMAWQTIIENVGCADLTDEEEDPFTILGPGIVRVNVKGFSVTFTDGAYISPAEDPASED